MEGVSPSYRKAYRVWRDIKERCYNPAHKEFRKYGSIGIKLQNSWENDAKNFCEYIVSLPNFSEDMSIDRIDNNKGYVEGNLRWATSAEQVRNRGKQDNNTSGFNGVTWYYNRTGGTRAVAWWRDENGKSKSKSFPVKRFGLLKAFSLAVRHRLEMINELNIRGAGYSPSHGTEKGSTK